MVRIVKLMWDGPIPTEYYGDQLMSPEDIENAAIRDYERSLEEEAARRAAGGSGTAGGNGRAGGPGGSGTAGGPGTSGSLGNGAGGAGYGGPGTAGGTKVPIGPKKRGPKKRPRTVVSEDVLEALEEKVRRSKARGSGTTGGSEGSEAGSQGTEGSRGSEAGSQQAGGSGTGGSQDGGSGNNGSEATG